MAKFLFLVFTRPADGQEAEYNRWYDEQHLADVLRAKGFTAAQRYRLSPQMGTPEGAAPPYLAIYEIEGENPQESLADLISRANTALMPISPALDAAGGMTLIAEPITERMQAEAEPVQ